MKPYKINFVSLVQGATDLVASCMTQATGHQPPATGHQPPATSHQANMH